MGEGVLLDFVLGCCIPSGSFKSFFLFLDFSDGQQYTATVNRVVVIEVVIDGSSCGFSCGGPTITMGTHALVEVLQL